MCSRDDDPTQHLADQPPVPGGTTAIRDGQYVKEERAPGPPRGPDTTRDPRNPRKPAAPAEGLREAAWNVVNEWDQYQPADTADYIDALRAALKETDREPTGTVARGASPRGLPEHGVSDVPSGSRPPRPPSPPKDREWDGS
jgi:hypothetical protein